MKVNKKYKGLVTKKFNEFFLVELTKNEKFESNNKFLCKIKKSIKFKKEFIFVGDEVILYQIDFQYIYHKKMFFVLLSPFVL